MGNSSNPSESSASPATVKVVYQHYPTTRELSAADFKALGVEGQSKTSFPALEPVEVPVAVAEALAQLPGEFKVERASGE